MNLLTELLLAILISALLAVNTVVQTNQQTNETAAIAVGAYLNTLAGSVARYYQTNGGVEATNINQLTTVGGLGLSVVVPANNGNPIFGVAVSGTTTIAYACTARPLSVRSINSDTSGRDALVNTALLNMAGSGARSYSSNPSTVYGAFGSIDVSTAHESGTTFTAGNGILCAWKNANLNFTDSALKPVNTSTVTCNSSNQYQLVYSTNSSALAYCAPPPPLSGSGFAWQILKNAP